MDLKIRLIVLIAVMLLSACRHDGDVSLVVVTPPPTAVSAPATPTLAPSVAAPTVKSTMAPTSTPQATAHAGWPQPILPEAALVRRPPTAAERVTAAELATAVPPARDDVTLAIAYRGLAAAPKVAPQLVDGPLATGTRQNFMVPDVINNTVSTIEAELLAVGDHAYFWFDVGPGSTDPDPNFLAEAVLHFDEIYEVTKGYFGAEDNPGLDGDPRVHIVNASPLALCGVDSASGTCPLAGLVNSTDLLPAAVDERSNEREMFVMNVQQFGTDFYLGVLAHEFRHMIEDKYDKADSDWAKEGSATLAAELAGYPSAGPERGNMFLQNPDQQLNSWAESGTAPYYGQGYLLHRYLFDRFGPDFYLDLATSPLPGLLAVDAVAAQRNLDVTGESVWLDWLAALVIHNDPNAPEGYRFESSRLTTATSSRIEPLPTTIETEVHQYAADYYELPRRPQTITFTGSTLVPLLDTVPASAQTLWFAQRANYSNPRLTRLVDLRDVEAATLRYAIYSDIERGYDFAYVSVSQDGGRTWQPLAAEQMQGLDAAHNPAGSALAPRFYSERTRAWVEETADLTPYAGQEILLRFEYVTDPILTYSGLALDNIAIPEIGFYDDAETAVEGWQAEGFTRATAYLPQTWHLQLITHEGGVPEVQRLALNADQTLTLTLDGGRSEKRPLLIIAASAPMTLQPAHYQLEILE